jgi:acyl-CoA synthetase (NDP forming)
MPRVLQPALNPSSIAIIGASDNPHKVGGRPLLFLGKYGYRGAVYPVNPVRASVQGLPAFPRIEDLPGVPDLAIVAVAGDEAMSAVTTCAVRGVKVAVVMTSGFGETGELGLRKQDEMARIARDYGMRLIGPNCQGLANFANGVVANFSTIFHELEARDGPVAIISQSGANSQAIYSLLREKSLYARHVHATGNEADVTVGELAAAIAADPGVRLVLLYMEALKDPQWLGAAAKTARERDVPIVALKAGRTARGQQAARAHTGAAAMDDAEVERLFAELGIWRAADPQELVSAAELYLAGRRPRGARLVFVSNSGASCVMAADYAEQKGIELAHVSNEARSKLAAVLPAFAACENPIDVTGALLGNPDLLGAVLPVIGEAVPSELLLLALPVAGAGYNLAGFARELEAFGERYGHAVALAAPQEPVRREFARLGIPTFAREREAMDALVQLARHSAALERRL